MKRKRYTDEQIAYAHRRTESGATVVNNDIVDETTGGDCGSGPCLPFNPFTETPVEGVHWRKDDDFGQPTSEHNYQIPREYRFSIGFRF